MIGKIFQRQEAGAVAALVTLLWLFISTMAVTAAERPEVKKYSVVPTTTRIILDGILDDEAWKNVVPIKLMYEWTPGDNIPPPVETEFLVTFNDDYLYLAFRCLDPEPGKIRAHLMDRDAIDALIQDDHVSVVIDLFNDERRGFQFRVNPLGVQADANFSENEGYEDFSWDAIWYSAGKIHDWGWAAEIAIPFSQLRFPKGTGVQTWGFSSERSYPRNVRHRITSHPRRRDVNCILCQFDKVTGFRGMKTGWGLEVDPTLTANRTDSRPDFPEGGMENGKIKADPGLTLRWSVTSNLVLAAAANPDFSQVEADVAQLEVNRRFAIRYPEKRPFFLEGADFFLTPVEAVFTRTVFDPIAGFKLTGKTGKNAIGVFATWDRVSNLLFPSSQGSDAYFGESDVGTGVFRFRRDIGRNSTVGFLYTGRAGSDYGNHVGGLDGFFRLSRTKTLVVQYLRSITRYPDDVAALYGQKEGAFGGGSLFVDFNHQSRDWIWDLSYRDFSPGFRADAGFVPRVDFREFQGTAAPLIWTKKNKDWFSRIHFPLFFNYTVDYQGRMTDSLVGTGIQYIGVLQSTVVLQGMRSQERYAGSLFTLHQGVLVGEIKPVGGVRFYVQGVFGDAIDYVNARAGSTLVLAPMLELAIGRHIQCSVSHTLERLARQGEAVYTANLSQVKLIYNFSTRFFIRAILQYLDLDRNLSMYSLPLDARTKTLFSQFLFSYKLNPQTVLFIGYSDNSLGLPGIDLERTDRTFFVKIGYAWLR